MSGNDALVPRTGLAPRISAGPKVGQTSLYKQHVLDEDTYTEALSHIITRDFFPNLPHIHATNAYLTALTNNDPELLSSSIRRLAALAQEKDAKQGGSGSGSGKGKGKSREEDREEDAAKRARRMEFDNMGTPYISKPGAAGSSSRPSRTPVGARGWETPAIDRGSTRGYAEDDDYDELEGEYGEIAGVLRPRKKRRSAMAPALPRIRDDLTLDIFQRNYTSEDNASFVQIVNEENKKRREDRWGWAWEAEKKAEMRKLEGEERRKMILDAATSGGWRVDGEGRRMIGGLAEPGRDRAEGEAWKDVKLIAAPPLTAGSPDEGMANSASVSTSTAPPAPASSSAVTKHQASTTSSALVLSKPSQGPAERFIEQPLPGSHPLTKALAAAGLPATALISTEDGTVVPRHQVVSGSGDGRGRGDEERTRREKAEQGVLGDQEQDYLTLAGSGADQWGYKTRNNLMFPADANADPYPVSRAPLPLSEALRQAPPTISHLNTRLPDEEEVRPASSSRGGGSSSRRGSSPARSWVDAAIKGTPYRPGGGDTSAMPTIDNYPLLETNPNPSPADLPSLLTWGTLLATPRALDGSDDPLDLSRPSFKLPETKRRDELGRKLGNQASRSMNERAKSFTPRHPSSSLGAALRSSRGSGSDRTPGAGKAGQMLPPSSTPKRTEALTPAARQLLQRSMGISGRTGGSALGTSGRNRGAAMEKGAGWGGPADRAKSKDLGRMSWTPSPAHRK